MQRGREKNAETEQESARWMESEKLTKYTVREAVMTARDRGNERE